MKVATQQDEGMLSPAVPGLRIVRNPTLRDAAVMQIQSAIERGQLKPGQRLTELGLAQELGICQATVREVLLQLENNGFIERRGPRKTFVASLTRKDIEEIYVVRLRLESFAVELLTQVSEEQRLKLARRECKKMMAAAELADRNQFYRADLAFHRALWKATANLKLFETLNWLVPRLFAFGIVQHLQPHKEKLEGMARTHDRLLGLIATGQTCEAIKALEMSMETSWLDEVGL